MKYGLDADNIPDILEVDMYNFVFWSTTAINTERSGLYAAAVQTATIDTHTSLIRAFMGYCQLVLGVPKERLGMYLYAQPEKVIDFLAYLRAREVGKGHLTKHCALAKKVNDFLKAGTMSDSPIRAHASRMERWLATLETQLALSTPNSSTPELPDHGDVRSWVLYHVKQALKALELWEASNLALTLKTARMVGGEGGRKLFSARGAAQGPRE